jgi:M3 family oligoendopeptidase
MSLQHLYRRPDVESARQQVAVLETSLQAAKTEDEFFAVLARWNVLRVELETQEKLARVMFQQNTQQKDEQEFFQKASPELAELDQKRTKILLEGPFGQAYAKRFGQHLLDREACKAASFHPGIKGSLEEEGKLVARYMRILSLPEIEFDGQKLNVNNLERFFSHSTREVRLAAQKARESFLQKNQDEFDEIFSQLVACRDGMGRALGYASYIPLAYQLRRRTTYGTAEVACFRAEIEVDVVPLVEMIAKQRAARLGVDPLLFHDEPVFDLTGNPKPLGDASFCLKATEEMFQEMGPQFASFFKLMKENDLFDIENRPNKSYGAFSTLFVAPKLPFVFANCNGSDNDVHFLIHECGHAFHGYNQRNAPLIEAGQTTTDASEVHSTSLENLAHPYHHLFFGEDAPRYQRLHMEHQLLFMPYAATVDAFEHEVYQRPHLTPKERRQLWRELEQRYQPYRNYGGLFPHMETGVFWHRQGHVFFYPFYYIDYVLASTCALQLWQRSLQNRAEALEDYLRICGPGGSRDFTTMLTNGRFVSPFSRGCLRQVAQAIEAFLRA